MKIKDLYTFIVAPLSKTPLQVGKPIAIELHEKLIFSNSTSSIVSLQADFGEGKTFTFQKGSKYTLTYNSAGKKVIHFVT